MVTPISIIEASIKADFIITSSFEALVLDTFILLLKYILCIYYLIRFKKEQAKIQALLNFNSEVNIISLVYVAKLGFKIRSTDVKAQKIDDSTFEIFKIVLTSFQVKDKIKKAQLF